MDKQYRDAYMKAARHQFGFKPAVAPNMRQLGTPGPLSSQSKKPLQTYVQKQAQPFPKGFGLVRPGVLVGKK
jgi:hypothetical protein